VNHADIGRAFSSHRFEEVFDHLADDVTCHLVGAATLNGRDAVVDACRQTAAENADTTTSWLRFVSAGSGDVVAVDAIGRYDSPDGVTAVSSCDIYEFEDDLIRAITRTRWRSTPRAGAEPARNVPR
jgi:hypothetical protein